VSVPTGAFEAVQLPDPPASVAVHKAVAPVLKATVPVGVPVPVTADTVARYVTVAPWVTDVGETETWVVEVGGEVMVTGVLAVDGV
jgi:hypothetical protein